MLYEYVSDVVRAKNLNKYMTMMIKAKVKTKASTLKAKAWAFEAKADAIGPEAKTIKFSLKALEAKAWPRGLHHCYNMSLSLSRRFI